MKSHLPRNYWTEETGQVNPKPFIWTASASDILAKVTRAKAALAVVSR